MTEWTTLSVKENTLERFRDIKEQLDETQDAPDHSADSFLQSLLDTWEAAEDGYYDEPEGEVDAALQNMRDEIMASVSAECGDVATTEDIRELVNRLDDLQSQLPKDVAGELR